MKPELEQQLAVARRRGQVLHDKLARIDRVVNNGGKDIFRDRPQNSSDETFIDEAVSVADYRDGIVNRLQTEVRPRIEALHQRDSLQIGQIDRLAQAVERGRLTEDDLARALRIFNGPVEKPQVEHMQEVQVQQAPPEGVAVTEDRRPSLIVRTIAGISGIFSQRREEGIPTVEAAQPPVPIFVPAQKGIAGAEMVGPMPAQAVPSDELDEVRLASADTFVIEETAPRLTSILDETISVGEPEGAGAAEPIEQQAQFEDLLALLDADEKTYAKALLALVGENNGQPIHRDEIEKVTRISKQIQSDFRDRINDKWSGRAAITEVLQRRPGTTMGRLAAHYGFERTELGSVQQPPPAPDRFADLCLDDFTPEHQQGLREITEHTIADDVLPPGELAEIILADVIDLSHTNREDIDVALETTVLYWNDELTMQGSSVQVEAVLKKGPVPRGEPRVGGYRLKRTVEEAALDVPMQAASEVTPPNIIEINQVIGDLQSFGEPIDEEPQLGADRQEIGGEDFEEERVVVYVDGKPVDAVSLLQKYEALPPDAFTQDPERTGKKI